jgi:hypothetical protein
MKKVTKKTVKLGGKRSKSVPVNWDKLPPGSDVAIELGCTCPILDNCYGKGYMGVSNVYCVVESCPVHGKIREKFGHGPRTG